MPHSLARLLVHLVFSTKNREPALTPAIRAELYPYLATLLVNDGCPSIAIGGTNDHVHILFGLSRTRTVAQVVETIKTASSKWLKTRGPELADFRWQTGYGAFSVSQSSIDRVIAYIQNQEEHHRRVRFKDEYRTILRRHGVEYEEEYVWD